DEKKEPRAREPLAEGEACAERKENGEDHYDEAELERARERVVDIDDAAAVPQPLEPVQRNSVHRESQSAGRTLERENEDDDHRAVEKQHEQPEEGRQPIESGRALFTHLSELFLHVDAAVERGDDEKRHRKQDYCIRRGGRELQRVEARLDHLAG